MAQSYSIAYMHHFFIHSSAGGHLGCSHILATANNAAMNIEMHVFETYYFRFLQINTQKWKCYVLLCLLLYSLCVKVYFVRYKYCYPNFFVYLFVSIFMKYLFPLLSVYIFLPEVIFL